MTRVLTASPRPITMQDMMITTAPDPELLFRMFWKIESSAMGSYLVRADVSGELVELIVSLSAEASVRKTRSSTPRPRAGEGFPEGWLGCE